MIDLAEHMIIDTLENCDSDQRKVLVRRVIRNVFRDIPASILEVDTGIRDAFEVAVV